MTKLVIQIPCYNEETALAKTLAVLPRKLADIDHIEWLVVDDGSTDKTSGVAHAEGVDHIIRFPRRQGWGRAFTAGADAALRLGADLVVNVVATNLYNVDDIPKLLQPILRREADLVIGARPPDVIKRMGLTAQLLLRWGQWLTRSVSTAEVSDPLSGFRAFSREAARRMSPFADHGHGVEAIIQAAEQGLPIRSMTVRTNPFKRRKPVYRQTVRGLVWIAMVYHPVRFFAGPGIALLILGAVLGVGLVVLRAAGLDIYPVPWLASMAITLVVGAVMSMASLITMLIVIPRTLLTDIVYRLKRIEDRLGR